MKDNNKEYESKSIEDNRWMANHISEILQGYQNGLSSNKEIFERISKDLLFKKEKMLNTILSFFITGITLIIGLSSLDPVKEVLSHNEWIKNNEWLIHNYGWILLIILVVFVLVALIIYIIKNLSIRNISKKLVNVEKEYYDGYTIQNFLKGLFNRYVLEPKRLNENPNKLNETPLQLLDSFFLIVQGAIVYKIFIKSKEELNNYEGFQVSDYSPGLFCLVTEYAYKEYNERFKSSQFFSYSSMPNSNFKEIFRAIDREKLVETLWNGKIKDFIEHYDEIKEYCTKSHKDIKQKKLNIFSRFANYILKWKR